MRSDSGIVFSTESNVALAPTGTRTSEISFGGVTPRKKCGLRSRIASSVVPDAFAIAAIVVPPETFTESYRYGGSVSTRRP